jgi:cell division septation protein DedD
MVNRPNIGNNTGNVVNRPNIGNNTGNVVNRPNIGNNTGNVVNRPNIGNNTGNVVNRPNIGNNTGNIINRQNSGNAINSGNVNINRTVNNNINNVNVNRVGNVGRPAWATGNPNWAYRPGWGYHQGWVNGYWHGANNNWWGSGGAFMTGMALGGIGAWGIGSSIYGWGYRPYVNPYFAASPAVISQPVVVQQPVPTTVVVQQPANAAVAEAAPVDYSQPLSTSAAPPEPSVADPAMQTFDAARAAFMAGNYPDALQKTDEALKTLPSDAAINEFRALCLFALGQYDRSAGTLYAVLSAGPGWDWTTLIGLYPNVDVYTAQVHALEDYRTANRQSAPSRFVLAYHYLTQGHNDAAAEELREVVKLQPSDQLSSQLLAQLSPNQPPSDTAVATTAPAAAPPPAPGTATGSAPAPAVAQSSLMGSWKGSPGPGTNIDLTLSPDSKFVWNVVAQGKSQPIQGTYALENDVLTLTQSENNAMVGKVALQDDSHFRFQAMGGGPGDPGLLFSK